ncbi:hypothetical protein E3J79_00020 [Candidatus Dependentiae bacterium]|nr:MAG: hypothetical protein E3J79_00020 [Candidatus Dependentiae bacterium]
MNNKLIVLCIITFLCSIKSSCTADHIINFFLQSYPQLLEKGNAHKYEQKIKNPGQIAKYSIKRLMKDSLISGIFATYGGYLTFSTADGQITFPNKQTKPSLHLAITNRITPIIMIGSTIHHWELEENTPVALYKIERKQNEEIGQYYWDTQPEALPNNKVLPVDTICIIAKPQKIYVPIGITLTKKSQNFLLPNIYVKKGIMKLANSLYILNLKHFFAPIKKAYKRKKTHYLEQIP